MNLINKMVSVALLLLICILVVPQMADARRMSPEQVEILQQQQAENDAKNPPKAQAVWQPKITDFAIWKALSKPVRDDEFAKFVLDVNTNKIYFFDSNVFLLHTDFVLDYLLKQTHSEKNIQEYNRNYASKKPQFILGYITHYPNLPQKNSTNGLWTLSFWEGDTIQAKEIARTHKRLQQTFSITQLAFRPDSSYQEKVAKQLKSYKISTINNHQIYQSRPFMAFNTGTAVGRLQIVSPSQAIESRQFERDEIVILQQSYPDISPVSGVITTQFSTPLSHVNLRATAWGIPNASLKTAVEDYANLNGKWVSLTVTEAAISMLEATPEQIINAQKKLAPVAVVLPQADLTTTTLATLPEISAKQTHIYGAKTANLGELMRANNLLQLSNAVDQPVELTLKKPQFSGVGRVNIPDGFGVPFYYYQQHLHQHGLDIAISKALSNQKFNTDKTWRNQQLIDLQQKIKAAPIDAQHFAEIKTQWEAALKNAPVFVRSSTNAEDLAGFNGAGLYDTVPNVKEEKGLEAAIKQVWASLWNARAVDERAFFGIVQDQVYVAVLIQKAVNASASGVLLTTDIWGNDRNTYTINAKWGLGMRVVEGQKMAEQILYDTSNFGTRVISRSDETTMLVAAKNGGVREVKVPKREAILTEQRAKMLGAAAKRAANVFKFVPVLDIEWVLESKNGIDTFWIVQARPYVVKK